ncbi:hypothetical protein CJ030_MR1G016599 [Morella rubra]|uniref:Reverse transcriptase domain-containing protein n=1 Tax=Morella rubra TaxID=262757 RepID=A0A6A1WMX5_9ROSI|nr:hypothetical protein CJ030_MR1G016599 [Morella rubra]
MNNFIRNIFFGSIDLGSLGYNKKNSTLSSFYTSSIIKRNRNLINKLKDSSNTWISDREGIGTLFTDFYIALFTTSTQNISDDLEQLIQLVLITTDVLDLNSIPSDCKIFDCLKSLGPTKAPGPDELPLYFFRNIRIF